MEPVTDSVEDYLKAAGRSAEMTVLDGWITAELPGISRVLWRGRMWGGTEQTIIGYGRLRQPKPRGAAVDWFLIGLAEQTKHLSVYVNAAEDGNHLIQERADRLGRVKVGAAALTFTTLEHLDHAEFRSLIARARALNPEVV
ncbi:DUF1801 domain-containing protein [Nesterenkonia sp. LB17]|uniref:DUF1801 domain-containing protein n=1 Tax=unclassified Nesterenkonia TaxID=2629769 RepID=UPI001F4C6782|nr:MULTISPECIES: DUF1801 domain-containing protein [unclassified Nesterenkonia]MCH8562012.1 DUF1801 domain-containing protein [Nesterenkonia sp. YGD6]MCH8564442.1 DUF1801 domain-containing protein [Nesterenkonia sp. LB17]